ncbi:MAG TPA: hypothetical protein VKF14_14620 [Candidatus Dormibacteraeota bacterium]|nr:hypothetical protein [Candidatus Dormibacteraeota bacterium]
MTQFMRASSWRRNDLVRTAGSAAVGDSAIAAGVGRVLQESVSMLTATMVQVNLAAAVRHLRPGARIGMELTNPTGSWAARIREGGSIPQPKAQPHGDAPPPVRLLDRR